MALAWQPQFRSTTLPVLQKIWFKIFVWISGTKMQAGAGITPVSFEHKAVSFEHDAEKGDF